MTAGAGSAGIDTSAVNERSHSRVVAIWLLVCCVTIFAMVVLGGVTRLTGSGLSMVQWAPIMGVLPPLNAVDWQAAFDLYQQYPEYQIKNQGMDLAGFKSIFYFEWSHRVLGRTIGVMFAIPFGYFLIRGQISRSMIPKMFVLFLLGGLQGLMGWYMVQSGLVDVPHVSQYRLVAHLSLAIVIYAYMFWLVMDLLDPERNVPRSHNRLALASLGLLAFSFVTVVSGGFVAGLKAGFAFNTFPLMNGQWIPENILYMQPLWRNLFENIATVQFTHRLLAISLAVLILGFVSYAWREVTDSRLRLGLALALLAMITQVTLGITTLLLAVPIPLAAAHQAGAVLLLTAMLFVVHQFRRR